MSAQRNCGYCKQPGHNKTNCPTGTRDAEQLCQYIRNLTQRQDVNNIEQYLKVYFSLLTVAKLTNMMQHISRKLTPLIEKMMERNKLTQEEASMRHKANRIKVLLWYFWYTRPRYIEYRH
jgi:hypothetical protein